MWKGKAKTMKKLIPTVTVLASILLFTGCTAPDPVIQDNVITPTTQKEEVLSDWEADTGLPVPPGQFDNAASDKQTYISLYSDTLDLAGVDNWVKTIDQGSWKVTNDETDDEGNRLVNAENTENRSTLTVLINLTDGPEEPNAVAYNYYYSVSAE